MKIFLLIVGLAWSFIGVLNIVMAYTGNSNTDAVIMILNMILFIFPGLVMAGIGYLIKSHPRPQQ